MLCRRGIVFDKKKQLDDSAAFFTSFSLDAETAMFGRLLGG
jgi:hypothetical protein